MKHPHRISSSRSPPSSHHHLIHLLHHIEGHSAPPSSETNYEHWNILKYGGADRFPGCAKINQITRQLLLLLRISALYFVQHQRVKAAVHHQPERAGRHLPAWSLSEGVSLAQLLLSTPLQTALLLPLLSFLPASTEDTTLRHEGNARGQSDTLKRLIR